MKRALLLGLTGAFALAQGAFGQNSAATPPPATSSSSSATAQPRPDPRGTRTSDQSAVSQAAAKQKVYKGNTGKKADPGTACSTARPTNNGGVDCGTGGKGATPGKVPK
jgi:hypothetical protein